MVRTVAFQAINPGSIPGRVTNLYCVCVIIQYIHALINSLKTEGYIFIVNDRKFFFKVKGMIRGIIYQAI